MRPIFVEAVRVQWAVIPGRQAVDLDIPAGIAMRRLCLRAVGRIRIGNMKRKVIARMRLESVDRIDACFGPTGLAPSAIGKVFSTTPSLSNWSLRADFSTKILSALSAGIVNAAGVALAVAVLSIPPMAPRNAARAAVAKVKRAEGRKRTRCPVS